MANVLTSTPRADGFRMPAEYEPHVRTWMGWPERHDTWPLGGDPARVVFAEVATAISRFEPVTVCASAALFDNARAMLPADVDVLQMESGDAWFRDSGPTFVVSADGRVRGVDWVFNAWGGLADDHHRDDVVAAQICEAVGVDRYRAPFVLEGGSVHVDGEGTALTTEECLLNTNRNPGLSRQEIEAHLIEYLGVERVIWLERGLDPEVTNGHIDDVACFARPGVVVLSWTDDTADWRHHVLAENRSRLEAARDAGGRAFDIHLLPLPAAIEVTEEESRSLSDGLTPGVDAVVWEPGAQQLACYTNFYVCNGGLVLPVFDDPLDAVAQGILERLFPEREVVPVGSRDIAVAGGMIHCITQQQPGCM